MLDADPAPENRMVLGGDVADGEDIRVGGAQLGIDGDSSGFDAQPGRLGECDIRDRADAHENRVGLNGRTVLELDSRDVPVGDEDLSRLGAGAQVDPVLTVQ